MLTERNHPIVEAMVLLKMKTQEKKPQLEPKLFKVSVQIGSGGTEIEKGSQNLKMVDADTSNLPIVDFLGGWDNREKIDQESRQ